MNDRIKLTTGGGGVLALFGLPFFLAGLFVLIAPELGVEIHSSSGGEASSAARWIVGGLFTALGGALVFWRSGLVIDRMRDEISLWWGILIPFSNKRSRPDDYELVALHREVRTSRSSNGGSSSYTVFPVRLRAKAGDDVDLMDFRNRQKGRTFAERVAKALDFGLAEATGAAERIRPAGTLDDSLRTQLRDAPPPAPQQPALGETRFETDGNVAVLDMPPPGFLRSGGVQACVGLLALPMLGIFALATGMGSTGSGGFPMFLVFGGVVAVFTVVPVGFAVGRGKTAERLRISADSVDVELSGPFVLGGRSKRVAMEDLEEVELQAPPRRTLFGAGKRVGLQTDDGCVLVGASLEEPQQVWLCDLIRYVAVHQRAPER